MRVTDCGRRILNHMPANTYNCALGSAWPRHISCLVEWASLRNGAGQILNSTASPHPAYALLQQQQSTSGPHVVAEALATWRGISTSTTPSLASRDPLSSDSATTEAQPEIDEGTNSTEAVNAVKGGDVDDEQKVKEIEDSHLTESMERLIMEAYKLLQQGQMQQAEQLLLEGGCFYPVH